MKAKDSYLAKSFSSWIISQSFRLDIGVASQEKVKLTSRQGLKRKSPLIFSRLVKAYSRERAPPRENPPRYKLSTLGEVISTTLATEVRQLSLVVSNMSPGLVPCPGSSITRTINPRLR